MLTFTLVGDLELPFNLTGIVWGRAMKPTERPQMSCRFELIAQTCQETSLLIKHEKKNSNKNLIHMFFFFRLPSSEDETRRNLPFNSATVRFDIK